MLTVNIGPLALAVAHVLLLGSLLLAVLTGWWVSRRGGGNPERQMFHLLVVTLLVARLAFVITYFEHYRGDLWGVFDIRDGGFLAWPGIVAALVLGAWLAWRDRPVRKPLGIALVVGVLSWGFGNYFWFSMAQGTRLPEIALQDHEGVPVALADYRGKRLVINLWATWCPPCQREMPVFEAAQAEHEEILFLFVNQGESVERVRSFLQSHGLMLENVLLDRGARLGQRVGSMGLPTTLFYDAQGRQVGSHVGELSRASLARSLEALEARNL
ncbi:redoxin domain-containing protein [Marinobacter sp. GN3S48]|uniref:redoxin domain-containing protein n=1 Tax=Marinobacter sp. GN3S48 TaxID=3382302 RepID=UPI00387AF6EA